MSSMTFHLLLFCLLRVFEMNQCSNQKWNSLALSLTEFIVRSSIVYSKLSVAPFLDGPES